MSGAVIVKPKKTSRVARGVATNELIFSAYQATKSLGTAETLPSLKDRLKRAVRKGRRLDKALSNT